MSFISKFFKYGREEIPPVYPQQPRQVDEAEKKPQSDYNRNLYVNWRGIPRLEMGGGRPFNYIQARTLALTPTPNMCRNKILADVLGTQCEIIPLSKEGRDKPTAEAETHAKEASDWFFNRVNDNGESPYTLIAKALGDLIDLDAGVIIKEYSRVSKQLVQLHARDGAAFLQVRNRYRRLGEKTSVQWDNFYAENYKVGYWENPYSGEPIPWEPHEVVYMIGHPRTDIYYGTSPFTVLRVINSALLHNEEFYNELMVNGAIGSIGISSTQNMQTTVFEQWRERINKILRGSNMIKTITADSDTKFTPLGHNLRDMLWNETREEYRNLTMAVFGLTSAALGFSNTSRGNSEKNVESQKALYIRMGLFPRLKTLEWYINNQILSEFFRDETLELDDGTFKHGHIGKWAGKPQDIFFRFKLFDPIGYKQQLEIDEQELKLGLKTHNDILKSRGYSPVSWGNFNPMFLLDPLKFSQGFSYNILLPKPFSEISGVNIQDIPPPPILEQVQPAAEPEETVKAYKKSRIDNVQN
ncbi:MAG: phage portal protein [Candidatus Bathyarchaeota archaeon]|nr:phage portal protein [Candidatus Bathyarchaeota archaeon]